MKKTVSAISKLLASVAAIAWAAVALNLYATLLVVLICAPVAGKVIYDILGFAAKYARWWLEDREHRKRNKAFLKIFYWEDYGEEKGARWSIWRFFKKKKRG